VNPREQYVVFFLVFIGVTTLTYGIFYAVDFLPEKPDEMNPLVHATDASLTTEEPRIDSQSAAAPNIQERLSTQVSEPALKSFASPAAPSTARYPKSIIIDAFNREIPIMNPESDEVHVLDAALLNGVVRHPDSADFGRIGTIFLFGHSSYLPNVINKNFQAFNGIQKLTWGDTIRLHSEDQEYIYRVDRVYEVAATNAEVKIETGTPKLALVTCNSFGSKDDRYVVEATLIESREL
jgi:LPXTG-site transpeptidase (sortase) family protein